MKESWNADGESKEGWAERTEVAINRYLKRFGCGREVRAVCIIDGIDIMISIRKQ